MFLCEWFKNLFKKEDVKATCALEKEEKVTKVEVKVAEPTPVKEDLVKKEPVVNEELKTSEIVKEAKTETPKKKRTYKKRTKKVTE